MQIIFWSGSKNLLLEQYLSEILVWHKKLEAAKNILGPEEGHALFSYSLALLLLIPSLLVWAEIECTVHFALLKQPINQFEPDQQSRQHNQRCYCPNLYFVA